jgi:tetratricopeptide (TPR) repeat protein
MMRKMKRKGSRWFRRLGDFCQGSYESAANMGKSLVRLVAQLFKTRKWRDAGVGLPALLVLLFLGAVVAYPYTRQTKEPAKELEVLAQVHLAAGRFAQARMAALRMGRYAEVSQKASFIQMQALRGLKRDAEAARLLKRLAPDEGAGYAPAHVLRAVMLFSAKPLDAVAANRHLLQALALDPDDQQALELSVRVASAQKDWRTALKHLKNLKVDERVDLLLLKAQVFQSAEMEVESVAVARKAEEMARRILGKADLSYHNRLQTAVAAALALQRKYEAATQWLISVSGNKPSPEAMQMMGSFYLTWSRYARTLPLEDKTLPLALLEQGLQVTPQNPEMLAAFLTECEACLKNEDERRSHVQRYLNGGGISSSFMHYFLGVQDWRTGNTESARKHWAVANKLNSNFPLLTNNLAMAVATLSQDQSELEKALEMINPLVRDDPQNPYFLDTRSMILSKLGRLEDALKDLEASLERTANKSAAHTKLAELYGKMGMTDQANLHSEKAASETKTKAGSN